MNRLLATASRAAGIRRSGGMINNHQHRRHPVSTASFPFATSSPSRHFADTPSSSSTSVDDDATNNSTTAAASGSNDDDEIQRGTVKNFNTKNGWGFIVPDGIDRRNHNEGELVFIHRADIKIRDVGGTGDDRYYPNLKPGQRVQFKLGPPANNKAPAGKAYDLTKEGGGLIPPFQPGYLDGFISKQKSMFGDEVYDIFSTSKDQKELEMKIVAAFDRVKGNIERQRAKVGRFSDMSGDDDARPNNNK